MTSSLSGPSALSPHTPSDGVAASAAWHVGPYRLVAEGWQADWPAYADKNYHRTTDAALPSLTARVSRAAPEAFGPQTVVVDHLLIEEERPDLFRITSSDAWVATFDLNAHRLDLEVLAHAKAPHLVLGNALRATVSLALPLRFSGLMFHASSGILDGQGVFFPGISTAGKTTLALGFERVTYLSDDITLTRALDDVPKLAASPFFGIAGRKGADEDAPLGAVGILVRKNPERTEIRRLRTREAVQELMRHAICWSRAPALHAALLGHVHAIAQKVPVFAVERFLGDASDVVMERVLEAAHGG